MIRLLSGGGGGGGGAPVPEWLSSYFEALAPLGTRVHCTVNGRACVAEAGLSRWKLVGPSVDDQAYAASNPRPTPTGGLLPNTRRLWIGSHMEFGTPILNNGVQWYWPLDDGSPQPGSFGSFLRNDEPYPIVAAASLLSSVADPPNPILALSYQGGSWVVDDAPPTPPEGGGVIAGDSTPTPTLVLSALKTLPAGVSQGASLGYGVVQGSGGYISQTGSLGQRNSDPAYATYPGGMWSGDRFEAGDHRTGISDSLQISVGLPSHLLVEYAESCPGYCQVALIADSLGAQTRPVPDFSREGVVFRANQSARAAGSKVRLATFSNGGARSSDILHRADAVADVVSEYCALMLIQIATANQAFADEADADARWAAYLLAKSEIEGRTGLMVRAIQMSPPPAFAQDAGNLAGWAKIRAYIATEGGVDLHDALVDETGTKMSATIASDGAHLTQAGVDAAFLPLRTQVEAILIAAGGDV